MNGIFVAATQQHIGKTTVSLSVMHQLLSRFGRVGFMKPVGQQYVMRRGVQIDKDASLFRDYFGIKTCKYEDMSPLVIDKYYTRRVIENKISIDDQVTSIKAAWDNIRSTNDFVVVEGTGHTAVGSVIGLSNAKVASLLGLEMLFVVNGGIGSTIDQFELNKAVCDKENVKIKGVVVNKILPGQVEKVSHFVSKYLERYDMPLLGAIPTIAFIDNPRFRDIERLFNARMLSNAQGLDHFENVELIEAEATDLFRKSSAESDENTLFVTHSSRDDVIVRFCSHASGFHRKRNRPWRCGLILCGEDDKTLNVDVRNCNVPILMIPSNTADVIVRIAKHTAKLNSNDPDRTRHAIEHYSKHFTIDRLLL